MAWTRQEKIDLLRGILQFLGILIMVACIVMVIKYRDILFKDCGWLNTDGTVEYTGLYGNCSYLNKFRYGEPNPNIGGGIR